MANKKRRPANNRARTAPQPRQPQSAARKPRQAARPAIQESALRTWVANRSKGPVVALSRLPEFLVPATTVVLMVVGLLAPLVIGVLALVAVSVFMGWLGFLSWPVLEARQRAMRVLAIALLSGAAIARIAGLI